MSIASRITAMQEHIEDDYEVLETAGADLTNVDKNIINLKQTWKERLLYFINNGVEEVWNNWEKVTGTGSSMTLNNTAGAPMSLTYNGNTIQDGTPTPDTPKEVQTVTGRQEIDVVGKNLYNGEYKNGSYNEVTGNIETNNNTYCNKNPIRVQPNSNYIFSINGVARTETGRYLFYDKNNSYLSSVVTTNSFTTPNNCYYINWHSTQLKTNYPNGLSNIQIEKGSEPTTYESFKGQSYEINLGKNLFDKDNANILNSAWLDSNKISSDNATKTLYIPIKGGEKYTVSKILSARFTIATSSDLPALNVSISNRVQNNSATSLTLTSSATAKYLCVYYYNSSADTLTEQEILNSIQIEVGSQASSYSAYKTPIELCKIGDYQDFIRKGTGKNLFDIDWYFANNGANACTKELITNGIKLNFTAGADAFTGHINNPMIDNEKIKVQSNTTYTLSLSSAPKCFVCYYQQDGTRINYNQIPSTYNATTYTFTTPSNCEYITIRLGIQNSNYTSWKFTNIQLEQNNQVTLYEPYGYANKWYMYKAIEKVVFNGSENWGKANTGTNTTRFFLIINDIINGTTAEASSNLLCDYFKTTSFNYIYDNDTECISQYGGNTDANRKNIYLRINNNTASTVDNLKTWLSNNNTTVYYVLAIPTTTEITDTELVNQLEEIKKSYNNITNINVDGILPTQLDVVALKM